MRSVRLVLALLGSLAAVGCTQPSSVQCPGGLVCPPGTTCAAKQTVCIKGLCGNGVIDTATGEACDDGNVLDGDGCSADCKSNESCGNGIVDTAKGEACDDGNPNSGDGCPADCKSEEKCGNGSVDTGEQCDPGADLAETATCGHDCPKETMGCNRDCTIAFCGDGKINRARGEECDDGVATADCNA